MFITPVGGATTSRHCENNTYTFSWQYEWSNADILLRGISIRILSFWKIVSNTKSWIAAVREDSSEVKLHQFWWRLDKHSANKSKKIKKQKIHSKLQNGLKDFKSQYSAELQKYMKWASYAKFVQIDRHVLCLLANWWCGYCVTYCKDTDLLLVWCPLGLIWWFMTYFIWSKFREGPKKTKTQKKNILQRNLKWCTNCPWKVSIILCMTQLGP